MGSSVSPFLDDLPCSVNNCHLSGTRLLCTTSRTSNASRLVVQLTVTIDNAKRFSSKNVFSHIKDPIIIEIKPLRSFASDGRLLSVQQKSQMVVYMDDGVILGNSTVCRFVSASQMGCLSPIVDFEALINARCMAMAAFIILI